MKKAKHEHTERDPEMNWEHCVHALVEAVENLELAETQNAALLSESVNYYSLTNIIAIATLVIECLTLTRFAFSANMLKYWGVPEKSPTARTSSALMFQAPGKTGIFHWIFWFSVAVSVFYCFYATSGIKLARTGELGRGPDGNPAKVLSVMWLYTQGLNLIGQAMYVPILSNMFGAVVCDYESEDAFDLTVVKAAYPEVLCWRLEHVPFVIGMAISFFTYYPMATFFFPNFQFIDKSLDIKYDPTFLIVLGQAKLLLAGIAAFLDYELTPQQKIQFSTDWQHLRALITCVLSALVFAAMMYYNRRVQPCIIKELNIYRTIAFMIPTIAALSTTLMILIARHAGEKRVDADGDITYVSSWQVAIGLSVLCAGWAGVLAYYYWNRFSETRKRKEQRQKLRAKINAAKDRMMGLKQMGVDLSTLKMRRLTSAAKQNPSAAEAAEPSAENETEAAPAPPAIQDPSPPDDNVV